MAEELKVKIIGDASSLKGALDKSGSGLDKFANKVGAIGKTMTVVGGAITAAFGAIVLKTAAVGDQFDKMSLRTGIAVEDLSALAYAADISGTDIGTLEKGLKGLTKTMDDASMGIGEGLEAFELLDIAVTDTEGNLRSTVDVLKETARKISAIENPTKQAALAMDLFGAKAGPQLLPLLKAGEGGIEDLMAKAKELGITMSTEAARSAAEFTDRLTDLKGSLAGVGRDIGEILIPPLTKLAEKVIIFIGKIKEWADSHKPLVEMLVKVAATVAVLAAVGGPILMAVAAFMKIKGAITAVSIAMKVFTASTGPIGWLILAAGALYLAWTTNFGGIQDFTIAVVDKVKEALGWLWDKVKWVLEKLGLYEEKVIDVVEVIEESIEPTNEFATANETLAENIEGVATAANNASEKIETYANGLTENYIALSLKATDSWADFYAFWEEEAKRVAIQIENTIEVVAKKVDNTLKTIKDAAGEITTILLPGGGIISTEPITAPNAGLSGGGYVPQGSNTGPGSIGDAMANAYHATGIDYVPKKGFYGLDPGEKVLTASEASTYNQQRTYSPSINITVQGNGNAAEIRKTVEQALDESARQYNRRGFELIPGMG